MDRIKGRFTGQIPAPRMFSRRRDSAAKIASKLHGILLRGALPRDDGTIALVFDGDRVLLVKEAVMLSTHESTAVLHEERRTRREDAWALDALYSGTPPAGTRPPEPEELNVPEFMRKKPTTREALGISVDDTETIFRSAKAESQA